MKNFILSGLATLTITVFSMRVYAEGEITKIADYKKVEVQFTKSTVLKLSQFVRDTGRGKSDTKNPNYRLLHESDKLIAGEVVCTVYQKTMLSNRTKNYAEEAIKFEKMITDKEAIILTESTTWKITRAATNELGILLWLQAEKNTLQIDCEKKNAEGKEQQMLAIDVLIALSANDVKFVKNGIELKTPEVKIETPTESL